MKNLFGLFPDEIKDMVLELGEPGFRADQITGWIYEKAVTDIDAMTNLPKKLRSTLKENCYAAWPAVEKKFTEEKSGTVKYLLRTEDDILIECVLLRYETGCTLCVSTQAGCRMGCVFCESGKGGLIRNLTRSEILGEVYRVQDEENIRISSIVLMGSGEPLDNYEEVTAFIRLVTMKEGLNLSRRAVTLSTCGLKAGICRLADSGLDVNLALSLHAPNHELRRQMLPVENANRLEDVMAALDYYRAKTGRRITCEYCLIEGKNDTIKCSEELYELLKNTDHLLNVIGVNDGSVNKRDDGYIYAFADRLRRKGLNVTVRRRLGSSINAACGQLKSRYVNDKEV